ncbi:MAG: hypothetical protein AB7F43_02735 [Bacteriovoracia bacterium]
MTIRANLLLSLLALVLCLPAYARHGSSHASFREDSSSSSMGKQNLMLEFTGHYIRDASPQPASDTAGRFSIGGMFSNWVGLDFSALVKTRSSSYLIGADFRLVPVEWLFFKVGLGTYSDKITRQLSLTPTAGAGIQASLSEMVYFITELSYFQVANRNNLGFGGGLGFVF